MTILSRERELAVLCLLGFGLVLGALALGRTYLDYGTETDFLGGFLPEAERLLAGQPLLLEWHPPLYAFALALVQSMTGDWVASGLLISYASGLLAVVCSFWFLRHLAGPAAAWGAVLGLAGSAVFVQYTISATSDVLFLALYLGSHLAVILALRVPSPLRWTCSGLVIGLAILTRSNALTLLLLAAAPFLCQAPTGRKLRHLAVLLLGLAIPLVLWSAYAAATGSALAPGNNHVNLALTYFAPGPDRISGFARQQVAGRFDGALDVLAHDPVRIARIYLIDLVNLVRRGLSELIEAPFHLLFLPGLMFLMIRRWSTTLGLVLAASIAQVLLVNMKAFEPRYYLFLVPLLGAGVMEIFGRLLAAAPARWARAAIWALIVLGSLSAVGLAVIRGHGLVDRAHAELAEAAPSAGEIFDASALVITRKPHLAFYTGATRVRFPNVTTLEALHAYANGLPAGRPLYLFYGDQERSSVPELAALGSPGGAPPWLRPVARSERPGAWVLYRYAGTSRRSGDASDRAVGKNSDQHPENEEP